MVNFGGNHLQKGPSRQTFFAKGAERARAISLGGGFKRVGEAIREKAGNRAEFPDWLCGGGVV